MQKKAVVCVTNDLSTDQRVHKTCMALGKCNYRVLEYGRLLPGSLPLERPYKTRRVKHLFNKGPLFYAEYNIRLFFYLLFSSVDLIFANDLDTLPAALWVARLRRKEIIYDSHEYYTETPELTGRPRVQRIWKWIEARCFPRLEHIITVNQSIAQLFQSDYGKELSVVRNIPATFEPDRIKTREELGLPVDKKLLIIQGSGINIDRGAEEACKAMIYLEGYLLVIIGGGDVIPVLKVMVDELDLTDKVLFKNKMPFSELRQYTMNCDLGLTLDKDTNINYRFSLPNKLFDFIHAGIPVLSSQLPEIKHIIDRYQVGFFIENHEPEHIADRISKIFSTPANYQAIKKNTQSAKSILNWEEEEKVLIRIINTIKV